MTDQPESPQTEQTATAYNRLRRLQEHNRSNLPAVMAHRATSTFTLHDEPSPREAHQRVLVIVYPQDPFVGEPEVRTMDAVDIRPGLVNARVQVTDAGRGQQAQPDEEGNYFYWPGDPRFDQVNVFYFTTFTLRMYERYARRALPWAFSAPRITVDPDSGNQANAFYSEQERLIGFHSFKVGGERISTAHSADIINHEAGHAVLDGLRDLYNESFGKGPGAFHESFADISAMLVALHDDSLIRRLLEWTNDSLDMDNFVTRVAEHLNHVLNGEGEAHVESGMIYLRNAFNDFTWQPFDALEYNPAEPEFTLGRQPHNYSRLFTGAFYDMLVGVYERIRADTPPHIAIYRARDIMGHLLVYAIELGPVGEFDFSDMARVFLTAEQVLYGGRYQDVLAQVFEKRGILSRDVVEGHQAARQHLPRLTLPETINSALASALFLEEQIIPTCKLDPTTEYVPLAAYRNADGRAFLTYLVSERITLEGAEYGEFDGAMVDLFGGLTLGFDYDDRLVSLCNRLVSEEDKRQVRVLIADLIQHGLITRDFFNPRQLLRGLAPQGIAISDEFTVTTGRGRLVKFPLIWDDFSPPKLGLPAFLRRALEWRLRDGQ
ncbi:MAG: hypothetical protein ACOCYT_04875 [Chloroflexota bacterium]